MFAGQKRRIISVEFDMSAWLLNDITRASSHSVQFFFPPKFTGKMKFHLKGNSRSIASNLDEILSEKESHRIYVPEFQGLAVEQIILLLLANLEIVKRICNVFEGASIFVWVRNGKRAMSTRMAAEGIATRSFFQGAVRQEFVVRWYVFRSY